MAGREEREARFRVLFDAHYDRVHAYAARRAGASMADDVAATTMGIAWRRLDEIDARLELPWLLTTARHVVSTTIRGDVRRRARDEAEHPAHLPDLAGGVVERSAIRDALDALSDADRELLLLCTWDDVAPADAARVLGLTPGTVRVRLHRARRRFRDAYAFQGSAHPTPAMAIGELA
ncbi:RNA polymerase sigma factor [Cellulomonas rhizosphaerae]|uniref:Sigma-70 family RNA polymerase sigma factor n=1 Tax=Cellulomonas rhizosphaerae TaxID=2293719 RepID=A0A413RM82_9CELL|nr:sigma-70 family RNA polymerase sigma factor [Cellulomonas rhizosphaerae]RHA41952.1 sigma-70 family RNA polymerase sigma factor [Cellulomonas rhizosphaerae]